MQIVAKAWGREEVIVNEEYCAKFLYIEPGWQSSLHMHQRKKETFYVLHGVVHLELGNNEMIMAQGDIVTVLPGQYHRFASGAGATILEISTKHEDSDVVRLEESRPSGLTGSAH